MHDLIDQYQESLRIIRRLKQKANNLDKSHLGSMESDLLYSLDWMKTARRPGNRRGVERLAAYQRENPVDPILIQRYYISTGNDPYHMLDDIPIDCISNSDKERIEDALSTLSTHEKEIYLMSRGHCLSYSEIANILCVSKSTVQDAIERAERKILKQKNGSLFCWCG